MNDQRHQSIHGRRVRHDETRKEGYVYVDPGNTATSVFVLFDGADFAIPCYPDSLEFVEEAA